MVFPYQLKKLPGGSRLVNFNLVERYLVLASTLIGDIFLMMSRLGKQ